MSKSAESWESWPIDAKRKLLNRASNQLESLPPAVKPHNSRWQQRLDLEDELAHLGLIYWVCRLRQPSLVTTGPRIKLWPHERRAHIDAVATQIVADYEKIAGGLSDADIEKRLNLLRRRGLVDQRWDVDRLRAWDPFWVTFDD